MQMVKPVHPKIEKEEQLSIQKKVEEKPKLVKKEPIYTTNEPEILEEKIENKKHILYTSKDSSGRYTIQLVSDIKIVIENQNTKRYVPIFGEIEEDSQIHKFSFSLDSNYIEYIADIKVIVKDISDENRVLETDAYFLSGVNTNSSYKIKLDVIGDSLNGYTQSSKQIPDFILNNLQNNTPVVIDEQKHNQGLEPNSSKNPR